MHSKRLCLYVDAVFRENEEYVSCHLQQNPNVYLVHQRQPKTRVSYDPVHVEVKFGYMTSFSKSHCSAGVSSPNP